MNFLHFVNSHIFLRNKLPASNQNRPKEIYVCFTGTESSHCTGCAKGVWEILWLMIICAAIRIVAARHLVTFTMSFPAAGTQWQFCVTLTIVAPLKHTERNHDYWSWSRWARWGNTHRSQSSVLGRRAPHHIYIRTHLSFIHKPSFSCYTCIIFQY